LVQEQQPTCGPLGHELAVVPPRLLHAFCAELVSAFVKVTQKGIPLAVPTQTTVPPLEHAATTTKAVAASVAMKIRLNTRLMRSASSNWQRTERGPA
jgi:hypothetical protein